MHQAVLCPALLPSGFLEDPGLGDQQQVSSSSRRVPPPNGKDAWLRRVEDKGAQSVLQADPHGTRGGGA